MGREIRMSSREVERENLRKLMLEISLELTQGFFTTYKIYRASRCLFAVETTL